MTELYDLEEIKRAETILFEQGGIAEVRALNTPKKTQIGFYSDRDKMARDIAALSGHASGVYAILNEINPALLARSANQLKPYADSGDGASDKDIIKRRFLPLDADPIRPSGISSTDLEHNAALDKAFHVSGYLHDILGGDGVKTGQDTLYRLVPAQIDDVFCQPGHQAVTAFK